MNDNKSTLILIGGGNFSAEIAEVAHMIGYNILGYIDNNPTNSKLKYLGTLKSHLSNSNPDHYYFPAFGAVNRKGVELRAENLKLLSNFNIPKLVSPKATISNNVKIERGTYIAHGVVINNSAVIDRYVIINTNSTIGHNVNISDGSIISGNVFIGGGCHIGFNTLIGPGSTLMHNINIGSNVIISLGSVVGRDLADCKTTIPLLSKSI